MPPKPAARGEYIETETGNKISRRASILGPKHIILAGKCVIQHDVIVHGDLVRAPSSTAKPSTTSSDPAASKASGNANAQDSVSIHLGRYVFISPHVTLHPPSRLSQTATTSSSNGLTYYPLRISDHVFVGPHSHVQAASIGANVYIGANVSVGNFVFIKDNVWVEDGTVLPAHSVWASGCVVAGRPGRVVGELGEGYDGTAEGRRRWESVGNKKAAG